MLIFIIFSGLYLINIKFNSKHVIGSPFELKVESDSNSQPIVDSSKIIINKEDLKSSIFGEEIKTLIDVRKAGSGKLAANCVPSAPCEFFNLKNGTYMLKIKPQQAGKHILHIKYNDVYLPDFPMAIKVSLPPDASKIKVIGPGINHGVINEFQSSFVCETKGAGVGELSVRIKGPKGAFKVDMERYEKRDRSILCNYDPLEVFFEFC
jgi:filamin